MRVTTLQIIDFLPLPPGPWLPRRDWLPDVPLLQREGMEEAAHVPHREATQGGHTECQRTHRWADFLYLPPPQAPKLRHLFEETLSFSGAGILLGRSIAAELSQCLRSPWTPPFCKSRGTTAWKGNNWWMEVSTSRVSKDGLKHNHRMFLYALLRVQRAFMATVRVMFRHPWELGISKSEYPKVSLVPRLPPAFRRLYILPKGDLFSCLLEPFVLMEVQVLLMLVRSINL